MATQQEKCERFRLLHEGPGAFLIANAYDVGSARVMQHLGVKAVATSSQAFAHTLGKIDGKVTLAEKLEHCRIIAAATDVPVNVDFEDGFARDPSAVADNIARLVETGVAGCSIEDWDREDQRIFDFDHSVERVSAAVEAVRDLGMPFQLTARAEVMLRRTGDLDAAIERLKAYEAAGADVLYAPGISRLDDLRTLSGAVTRPINLLGVMMPSASISEMAAAGAKRISVGSALGTLAMAPVIAACREMLDEGSFSWLSGMTGELESLIQGA